MIGGVILFLVGGRDFPCIEIRSIPLGRLPGDVRIEGEDGLFDFPVASSILVSVVLTDCAECDYEIVEKIKCRNSNCKRI